MAVSHAFTNNVADATGTLSIWYGATTATVAASDIVKPSDWNSAHVQAVTLSGNTAGVSSITGTNIVFGGSNNVTLSGIQGANAGTINISAAAGGGGGSVNISAGTTSNNLTNFVFANSNGVSFGLNGSTVTATVQTNYLTTAQPVGAYLTTARASNDAIGLNTAQSNVTWTVNSSGLSLDARGYAGSGFTSTTTAGTALVATQNSNGLSMAVPAFLTTAQPVGAYLTTARASNDAVGLNTAGTNVTWTVNSSGISINASGYAGSGFTSTTTAGTAVVGTHNSAGLSMGFPAFITNAITTARASTDAIGLNTAQSNVTWTVNSSGLSLDARGYAGTATGATNASVTVNSGGVSVSVGNYITTARGSTDAIGLNAAQSNVTWTVNSSGLSLDARGYAGTGTTFNGANVSGSITLNSAGLQLSLSGATAAPSPVNISAGTTSNNLASIVFSNSNGVSFGLNGSTITASAAGGGGGIGAGVSNLGNTAGSTGTVTTGNVVFVGSNGITLSQSTGAAGSAATITILGNQTTIGGWEPVQANNNTTMSSMGQNTFYMQKVVPEAYYSFNNIELRMSGSFATSTNSQVVVHTIRYGLYTLDTNNSYNSISTSSIILSASISSNVSMGYTISQGAGSYTTTSAGTAIASLMTGLKHLYMPFTTTLVPGSLYGVAFHISSASTGSLSAHRMSILNQTIINNLTVGKVFASTILATNASFVGDYDMGVGSVTTAALPSAIAKSAMTAAVSQERLFIHFDA
jgi:hypothetical protein